MSKRSNVFTFRLFFLFGAVFFLAPGTARSGWDWKTLKTGSFVVFYKPGYELQAWKALQVLEHFKPSVEKLTGNHVPPLSAIVIQDMGTYSNGLTDPVDRVIQLFTYSSSSLELPAENWWMDVGVHEYTHMLHLNHVSGLPGLITRWAGNSADPNLELPDWIDEGFAVYSESQPSPYSGRLNDGFFDAYLLASAKDNRFPSLMKASYTPLEYPDDTVYEAGGGFHKYLAQTYGEEKFSEFYSSYGGNLLSYLSPILPCLSLDPSAEKAFGGKSIPELWEDWRKSIGPQAGDFKEEGEQLTRRGWSLDGLQISGGKLYYKTAYTIKTGIFDGYTFHEIMERDLDFGKERKLVSTSTLGPSLRARGGKLYYSLFELKEGFANTLNYGYDFSLHEKDPASGQDRVLMEDSYRAFEVLPNGRILYSKDRRENFGSNLYSWDPSDGKRKFLFSLDFMVDEIISDEKRVVVTAKREYGQYNLYMLDLEKGFLKPLVPSAFLERNPQLEGNHLYFNANFNKCYGLYRYDFSTRKLSRLTDSGYAASPAYDPEKDQLYYAGLNSYGNDLYRVPPKPKSYRLKTTRSTPEPGFELNRADVKEGGYTDNLGWMAPQAFHFPLGEFSSGRSWIGLGLVGTDALYQFAYTLLPAYDFQDHHAKIDLDLSNLFFSPWVSAVEYTEINSRELLFQTAYPLVLKVSPGLDQLDLGLDLDDDFTKTEWDPFLIQSYYFPSTSLSLLLTTPLERESWGSYRDRTGAYAYLTLKQYLPHSELEVGWVGIEDQQNNDTVFPTLRGYANALGGLKGMTASVDYAVPVFNIHGGLWNPSFYFEDLVLDAFSDGAFDELNQSQWSFGAEIHLETKLTCAFTGIPADLGFRYSHTQEGSDSLEGFFNFNLSFLLSAFKDMPLESGAWRQGPGMPPLGRMQRFVQHPDQPTF